MTGIYDLASLLRGLEADQAIRQYHWVSELAPKRWQKLLSYIVGRFTVFKDR